MPAWGPTTRRRLIAALRALGFDGPFIGVGLPALLLRQAGITRRQWEDV